MRDIIDICINIFVRPTNAIRLVIDKISLKRGIFIFFFAFLADLSSKYLLPFVLRIKVFEEYSNLFPDFGFFNWVIYPIFSLLFLLLEAALIDLTANKVFKLERHFRSIFILICALQIITIPVVFIQVVTAWIVRSFVLYQFLEIICFLWLMFLILLGIRHIYEIKLLKSLPVFLLPFTVVCILLLISVELLKYTGAINKEPIMDIAEEINRTEMFISGYTKDKEIVNTKLIVDWKVKNRKVKVKEQIGEYEKLLKDILFIQFKEILINYSLEQISEDTMSQEILLVGNKTLLGKEINIELLSCKVVIEP
jgi:hypothetical protein